MATNTIDVLDATGKKTGTVELPEAIFGLEVNVPLIHQVVVAQQAAARQGTHSVKNRGERSGSGRKPFKQKGTGNARQGSVRMPQHRGGGIVHGPTPRSYAQRTPKKMIAAALLQSLSDRARNGQIHVFSELVQGDVPSTRNAVNAFRSAADGRNVLIVVGQDDVKTRKSIRNLQDAHVLSADQLNVYDVLHADDIVFLKEAFDAFVSRKTGTEEIQADSATETSKEQQA